MSAGTTETGRPGIAAPDSTPAAGVAPMVDIRPSAMADPLGPLVRPRVDLNPLQPSTPVVPGGPGAGGPPRPPDGPPRPPAPPAAEPPEEPRQAPDFSVVDAEKGGNRFMRWMLNYVPGFSYLRNVFINSNPSDVSRRVIDERENPEVDRTNLNADGGRIDESDGGGSDVPENEEEQEPFGNGPESWWPKELGKELWGYIPPQVGHEIVRTYWESLPPEQQAIKRTEEALSEQMPLEARSELLWDALKDRPDYRAYLAMQYYQGMDWDKRTEDISKKFKEAGQVLTRYALKKKLDEQDPRITEVERRLVEYDRRELGRHTGERRKQLKNLIDELDAEEYMHEMLGKIKSGTDHSALTDLDKESLREMRKQTETRKNESERDIARLKDRIKQITGDAFIIGRGGVQSEIRRIVKGTEAGGYTDGLESRIKTEKEAVLDSGQVVTAGLIRDFQKTRFFNEGELGDLTKEDMEVPFSEVVDFIQKQESLKEQGSPDYTAEFLQRAYKNLEWRIYQARESQLLEGIDRVIEADYQSITYRLSSGAAGRDGNTIGDIRDEIMRKGDRNAANLERDFDRIAKRLNLSVAERERFKGIREFVANRGYESILDLVDSGTVNAPYMGEWDIRKAEYIRNSQSSEAEDAYYRPSEMAGYIRLTGRNAYELEKGTMNYINNLLRSASGTDLEAILGSIRTLDGEITRRGITDLHLEEEVVNGITDTAYNMLLIHVTEFQMSILHMENGFKAGEKWADGRGDSRFKKIPQMHEGMTGYALHLLRDPRFILYFRPEGWKGQLTNNQEAQRLLRSKTEDQIEEELMEHELIDRSAEGLKALAHCKSDDDFTDKYRRGVEIEGQVISIAQLRDKIKTAEGVYKEILASIEKARQKGEKVGFEALNQLDNAKIAIEAYKKPYEERRERVKSALKFALQVNHIFGESAEIGAPSLNTKEGERVPVPLVRAALNLAVRQSAERTMEELRQKGIDVTNYSQLIRWRALHAVDGKSMTNRFVVTTKDKEKEYKQKYPDAEVIIIDKPSGKNTQDHTFQLQKGFEDTGLTVDEFSSMYEAYKAIHEHGFNAEIGGVKLSEVAKMEELIPVENNYLANDRHGSDVAWSPITREDAAKGREPYFASIYKRLKWFGVEEIYKDRDSGSVNKFRTTAERVIENCRSLDEMVSIMVDYFGTRADLGQFERAIELVNKGAGELHLGAPGKPITDDDFAKKPKEVMIYRSPDVPGLNLYLDDTDMTFDNFPIEYPGLDLGMKRYAWLKYREFNQKEEFVARGIQPMIFWRMPYPSVSRRFSGKNLLEVIWNYDREIKDIWQQQLHFVTGQTIHVLKAGLESERTADGKTRFTVSDKHLSNVENVFAIAGNMKSFLLNFLETSGINGRAMNKSIVQNAVKVSVEIFERQKPIFSSMAKLLEDDRAAVGSGAALETLQKIRRREDQWELSRKRKDGKGRDVPRREQGGLVAHSRTKDIITAILTPGTYGEDGASIKDRDWEEVRPVVSRDTLPPASSIIFYTA